MDGEAPRAEFFSIYDGARLPSPASDDLMGAMPVRAAQFCLPLKAASGLGFYLYPPVDFAVRWDGRSSELSWLDDVGRATEWRPLEGGADVFLPDSGTARAAVPEPRRPVLDSVMHAEGIPFVNADPRAPAQMEITTGLVVRTPQGWGSLVGGLANWTASRDHQVLQGFVETDWYRTFVPIIVRLTTPGAEVRFFQHLPMAQLQVLPVAALAQTASTGPTSRGVASWPDDVWEEFVASRAPRHTSTRMGTYRTASRKAAANDRCPYTAATRPA